MIQKKSNITAIREIAVMMEKRVRNGPLSIDSKSKDATMIAAISPSGKQLEVNMKKRPLFETGVISVSNTDDRGAEIPLNAPKKVREMTS